MVGFFDRMLGRNSEKSSANQAKERLQFVLVHDRINLPPERLKEMKEEILAVISKYVDVESEAVDIALQQRDRKNNLLVAEIPFTKGLDPITTSSDVDSDEAREESESASTDESSAEK